VKLYGAASHGMMAEATRKFDDPEFAPESLNEVGDHYTLPQTPSNVFIYIVKNTRRRLNG